MTEAFEDRVTDTSEDRVTEAFEDRVTDASEDRVTDTSEDRVTDASDPLTPAALNGDPSPTDAAPEPFGPHTLHPDQLEALCLLPYEQKNVRELIGIANHVAARHHLEGIPPARALGRLLADRYANHRAVARILSRAQADRAGRAGRASRAGRAGRASRTGRADTGAGSNATAGASSRPPIASHYERHKETILAAYRDCEENLSATERALKRQGLRVSRRWLRDYLRRWGER